MEITVKFGEMWVAESTRTRLKTCRTFFGRINFRRVRSVPDYAAGCLSTYKRLLVWKIVCDDYISTVHYKSITMIMMMIMIMMMMGPIIDYQKLTQLQCAGKKWDQIVFCNISYKTQAIQTKPCKRYPPHLNNVSTLRYIPCETYKMLIMHVLPLSR